MRNAFGLDFDVPDGYLNTANTGIPPTPVGDAVTAALEKWRTGRSLQADVTDAVAVARAAFGRLVGVAADRVAIGATVSGLVGIVAASVPPGARVLVARGEFTSLSWPFLACGAMVVEVEPGELAARAPEFDVVAVSVVQSSDGRVADLAGLRAAQAAGTRVVLDTTQATGWFDADLGWADAVVGAGFKWLLGSHGVSWMAVHPEFALMPGQAGWYASADPWSSVYGLPLRLAPDARAFDISPSWFPHIAAAVALPWLAGLDRPAVHAHCVGLADTLRTGLGMEPAGSAIVAVRRPDAVPRLEAAGILASFRAGAARLAFHLYNTESDVDRALDALT